MPHLTLSFLGGLEVTLDGEPVTGFRSDKARALLAFLVLESAHPHRRTAVADMLWPDLPEKKAAHNLSQTLLRLRYALREPGAPVPGANRPFLLLTRQDVQFNPHSDFQLDVVLFAELLRASQQHAHRDAPACAACVPWLHQAADLYRGDLLAGFFVRDSVGFEEWQMLQQELLHRQAVDLLARLATYHESRTEHELVLRYAGRLVALEPWHEQGRLQLMRALARTGQATAALEQYILYRRTLAEEFDLLPSAEASTLFESIRSGQVGRERVGELAPGRVAPAGQNDRRQITALICGRHQPVNGDPEGQVDQLARCSQRCAAVLERYAGHRQPPQGATCLIYFGYPVAQEDAARRAVRAGLALVQAAADDEQAYAVGIHTGVMAAVESWLVGDAPDLARGCQHLATPHSVWLTADAERLVRGWFDCQQMGQQVLPGVASPIEVYQVLGKSSASNRLEWLAQTQSLTALVGREAELDRLLALDDQARGGSGQIVLISGEPGIGKSRLLREFKTRRLAHRLPEAGAWLESGCLPYFQNTSLYPLISLLEQLLSFEAGDSPSVKHDKLDSTLADCDLTHPAAGRLLAQLLGLPTATPTPQPPTADQRERMREMLVMLLQKQAARQPLIIVIEDLHWSDPTTIEWLGRSFAGLSAASCLLVLTCRPTFSPPWPPRANLLSLGLAPLSSPQAASLVTNVAGARVLSDDLQQRIVRHTDGIPLFVEELTKTVLDQQAARTSQASTILQIPATLRDSLLARLDYMGAAKETAQWAAVLGRDFAYPILRAIVPYDAPRLQDDLAALVEANLIMAQGRVSQARFAFRHTLIQEIAYDSMLRQTRQNYHRRVAETLETTFPQIAESQPEILAQHYLNAGLKSQAVDFWLQAAKRATTQGATLEARAHFDRALEQIEPGDDERRWHALMGREKVFSLRSEREAQRGDIEALLELAEAFGDDERRARAYQRQVAYALRIKDFALMLQACEAGIAAANRAGNHTLTGDILSAKVTALTYLGAWSAAQQAVEETLLRLPEIEDEVDRDYTLADLAFYYSRVGDLSRALPLMRRGAEAAQRAGNRGKAGQYAINIGFVSAQLGHYAEARAAFENGLVLAEAIDNRALQTSLRYNLSYVLWCSGKRELAQATGEQALLKFKTTVQNPVGHACCLVYLGIYAQDAGNLSAAAEYLAEARDRYLRVGMAPLRMEGQAVEARCLLALEHREEARQLATEVWDHLREQGSDGMDFPSRAYLCTADVLEITEAPDISVREVIAAGYHDLMKRADKISDATWRQSFLENVAENREIVKRWQQH